MTPERGRVGLLVPSTTPVWTGTVSTWTAATFTLVVSTVSGTLATGQAGYVLVRGADLVRVRSVTPGSGTLALAETGVSYTAGDVLALYAVRLPFTRYQRVTTTGVVYKDYDIAWASAAQTMPPCPALVGRRALVGGGYGSDEALVWVEVGETVQLNAGNSQAMASGATVSSYAWDAGGGTITGSGVTVTASWATAGVYYLSLTVTDSNSQAATLYWPIWVGQTPASIEECSITRGITSGGTAQISTTAAVSHLRHCPAALVDLDTRETLFFGFLVDSGASGDFEITTYQFQLEDALAYSKRLSAFPFKLVDLASPDEWAEVKDLTVERALWYLLYWHSTLPQLVSLDLGDPGGRRILAQKFPDQAIGQQVGYLLRVARYAWRAEYGGGGGVTPDYLYSDSTVFNGLVGVDLSDAGDLYPAHQIEPPDPQTRDVRTAGYYHAVTGDWEPAIARAPGHPFYLGSSREENELAPLDAAELLRWAEREVALDQFSERHTVGTAVAVTLADAVADLPGGVRIAVEELRAQFNADELAWSLTLSGRDYGDAVVAVSVPAPPPVVTPPVTLPSLPPVPWIPESEDVWGDGNRVAMGFEVDTTGDPFVVVTTNFLASSPNWVDVTGNLATLQPGGKPWQIQFAQGGATPLGLYALLYATGTTTGVLYYLAAPYGAAPYVWEAVTLPTGYKLAIDDTWGIASIWPEPSATGRMLLFIMPSTVTPPQEASVVWYTLVTGVTCDTPKFLAYQNIGDGIQAGGWGFVAETVWAGTATSESAGANPDYFTFIELPLAASGRTAYADKRAVWEANWAYKLGLTAPGGTPLAHWPAWLNDHADRPCARLGVDQWLMGSTLVSGGVDDTLAVSVGITVYWLDQANGMHLGMLPQLATAAGYCAVKNNADADDKYYWTDDGFTTYTLIEFPAGTHGGLGDWCVGFYPGNQDPDETTPAPFWIFRTRKTTALNTLYIAQYVPGTGFVSKVGDFNTQWGDAVFELASAGRGCVTAFWGLESSG